jgi:hypothetical protein
MTIHIKSNRAIRLTELSATILFKVNRRITRAIAHLASLPAQITWGLSKSAFVEDNFLTPRYQKTLSYHQSQLPVLEKSDERIVEALEKTGLCITSLSDLCLPKATEFFKAAQHLTLDLKDIASFPSFDNHEVHASKNQLVDHPEIFYWGLNERLLEIIEKYLGLPVAYDGASCFLSVPNGKEIGARAWHRDREDRRMVKVCVYLSDVDEESGPFQCLKPDFNTKVCNAIKYRYKSVFDREMEKLSATSDTQEWVSCTGKAGTVIFVDTARFYHRGKPPTQKPRAAVFFSYFSRRPWHPFFCQRTPLTPKETRLFAHHLSENQRACVNWQDHLPRMVKWIPKSRI